MQDSDILFNTSVNIFQQSLRDLKKQEDSIELNAQNPAEHSVGFFIFNICKRIIARLDLGHLDQPVDPEDLLEDPEDLPVPELP